MSFRYRTEYTIFRGLLLLFQILPKSWVAALGRGFGSFCFHLGIRRSVVEKNLSIAFGNEMSEKERTRLAKKVYKNVGSVFFEVLLMRFIPKEKLGDYITVKGIEHVKEALEEGKGVLMAGGHYGHWELLSAGIASHNLPVHGYAGKQKNDLFDKDLNGIRAKFGMTPISKSKSATRQMLKVLKQNELLGILGDLNVPHDNLFVDFFGKKAAMGSGLATFAVMKKTPIFFMWNVRKGPLQHEGNIVPIKYELTGDNDKDIAAIAQQVSDHMEKAIREHPDHYFWFNRRWKTRPEGDDEDVY